MALVEIVKSSGIPLVGALQFGIIDRGSNLLQVRCTTVCNMRCKFCSTSANDPNTHPTNFIVDIDYLLEEVEKVAKIKGDNLVIFLDSVGEPTSHPRFVDLVAGLKKIPQVKEIIVITNGTLLPKERLDALNKAGLDRINMSFHALNSDLAKSLFGIESYDINKVMETIDYIKNNTQIDLILTPVWLHGINDHEIEKIIIFAKKINCKIGIQNYEAHKYGRKMKGAKRESYYKFYKNLKDLEIKHDIKLVYGPRDFNISKAQKIETPIHLGEKINTEILSEGWFKNQKIVSFKSRSVTVRNCDSNEGDKINLKVIENKNNIYLAEKI